MHSSKLKIGILLDVYEIPGWEYDCLKRVAGSEHAEIALVILKGKNPRPGAGTGAAWRGKGKIVSALYNKIDHAFFRREPDALRPMNALELLSGLPEMKGKAVREKDSISFEPSYIERIKSFNLDLIVNFGAGQPRGNILSAAKFGVWSYLHGRPMPNGGSLPGLWEVLQDQRETEVFLRRVHESSEMGEILYRASFPTFRFSAWRNRDGCYWGSSPFLARQIEALHRLGEKGFFDEVQKLNYDFRETAAISQTGPPIRSVLRLTGRILKEIIQRGIYWPSWQLLYDLKNSEMKTFAHWKPILPPKDRFWADPHIIQVNETYYIFIEEYIYQKGKGRISVMEMDSQGSYKEPVPILEEKYHLSYPFVFQWDGKYFLVPESAQDKRISLYECEEFPYQWKRKMDLMENILAVDTTLLYQDQKWWLFTGMAETEGAFPQVELFLFYADRIFTRDWTPHPRNPIVPDVKRARPAGRIFARDGKLFRPSQESSCGYGYGFDINEILHLSEREYREEKVLAVRPVWNKRILGTHSYAAEGNLRMIDVFSQRRKVL